MYNLVWFFESSCLEKAGLPSRRRTDLKERLIRLLDGELQRGGRALTLQSRQQDLREVRRRRRLAEKQAAARWEAPPVLGPPIGHAPRIGPGQVFIRIHRNVRILRIVVGAARELGRVLGFQPLLGEGGAGDQCESFGSAPCLWRLPHLLQQPGHEGWIAQAAGTEDGSPSPGRIGPERLQPRRCACVGHGPHRELHRALCCRRIGASMQQKRANALGVAKPCQRPSRGVPARGGVILERGSKASAKVSAAKLPGGAERARAREGVGVGEQRVRQVACAMGNKTGEGDAAREGLRGGGEHARNGEGTLRLEPCQGGGEGAVAAGRRGREVEQSLDVLGEASVQGEIEGGEELGAGDRPDGVPGYRGACWTREVQAVQVCVHAVVEAGQLDP